MTIEHDYASPSENHPPKSPRKTPLHARAGREFQDADYWEKLAAKHLSRYDLPKWSEPCIESAMRRWLDRLNLNEHAYQRATATSLGDFIELNRNWSLRAWLGTVLELADEAQQLPRGTAE